jgi:hypothetical protein
MPPQSKLDPFREELLEWRAENLSYEQILENLNARGISIQRVAVSRYINRLLPDTEKLERRAVQSLESFRTEITTCYINLGFSINHILQLLHIRGVPHVGRTTLFSYLRAWGISKRTTFEETPILRGRIVNLFYQFAYSDSQIQEQLQKDGFPIPLRSIVRIRKEENAYRRMSEEEWIASMESFRTRIETEMNNGLSESFGRGLLYSHFRGQGFNISRLVKFIKCHFKRKILITNRDRLFTMVKEISPNAVRERLVRIKRHRGHWISPGPNYMWSMDAHLKLQFWGIEVYAAIDTFSRYIIWSYVGISATTAVSCARQFLDCLVDYKFQPQLVRTDRGNETVLIADAQFTLSKEFRTDGADILLRDCFRFGTSKENQRIEAWWLQLGNGALLIWRVSSFFYYRTRIILIL